MRLFELIGAARALLSDETLHERSTRKRMASLGHRTLRDAKCRMESLGELIAPDRS